MPGSRHMRSIHDHRMSILICTVAVVLLAACVGAGQGWACKHTGANKI